MNNGLKEIC